MFGASKPDTCFTVQKPLSPTVNMTFTGKANSSTASLTGDTNIRNWLFVAIQFASTAASSDIAEFGAAQLGRLPTCQRRNNYDEQESRC